MNGEWIRPLLCPICDRPLMEFAQTWQCANQHSFDIAREGYVNLLRRQKKLPQMVGDSPEMLRARREFLARGFYDPLSDLLNERVVTAVTGQTAPVVVDIGCGEGHYTGRLAKRLAGQGVLLYGVDIAKTAVRLAAKQVGEDGRFLVADVHDKLPFADQSVQVLLNSFAPRHAAEFARLLAPGGLLLVVAPAPDHLQSLRARFGLMGIQDEKEAFIKAQFARLFALQNVETLVIPLRLDNAGLLGLINMMPGVRHLLPEQWKAIHATPQVETTASFLVLQMQRVANERFTG